MVSTSAVLDAVMVTEHTPSLKPVDPVVQVPPAENVTSPLVENVTTAPGTRFLLTSLTVAVAVEDDDPSAVIEVGSRTSVTVVGGPVSINVAVPEPAPTLPVIVSPVSGDDEAWMVTEQVPKAKPNDAVVQVFTPPTNLASPLVLNVTRAPPTRLWARVPSLTTAVALEVEAPSAGMDDGDSVTATCAGPANSVRMALADLPLDVAVIVS